MLSIESIVTKKVVATVGVVLASVAGWEGAKAATRWVKKKRKQACAEEVSKKSRGRKRAAA